jgi:hypothetical protein
MRFFESREVVLSLAVLACLNLSPEKAKMEKGQQEFDRSHA